MFLLIYSIIQEAIAVQLFSATFTAATAIIQIIILVLTHQPSSYKPYKPKSKWRKKVKAKCKLLSDKASSTASDAFEWPLAIYFLCPLHNGIRPGSGVIFSGFATAFRHAATASGSTASICGLLPLVLVWRSGLWPPSYRL